MLSYRIQGIRNPTLAVPSGARLYHLVCKRRFDMRHDLRFGHIVGEFVDAPEIAETAGTTKLAATSEDKTHQAEEIVVKANENGQYKYFCSVRTHAKGGMWGHIAVGVKPDPNAKPPEKTEHVHSPDEDKDHPHDEKPVTKPAAKPSPTPHDHQMPGGVKPSPTPHDHQTGGATKDEGHAGHAKEMSSTVNIGDPMNREGSGTSWLPDSSPMYRVFENVRRRRDADADGNGVCSLHADRFDARCFRRRQRRPKPFRCSRICSWRCIRGRSAKVRSSAFA